jgi:hypothetical protein
MTIFSCALTIAVLASAQVLVAQHPAMPAGMTHDAHLAQMDKDRELKARGAAAMGFDQHRTSHHFRLFESGGAIEVVTNDPADVTMRDQVRTHLRQIAVDFASGDFAKPFMTHGEVPPGVDTMRARAQALTFTYEDRPDGGMVRIGAADANTRNAVHDFLRYQIREHATGDPLTVGTPREVR